MSGQVDRFFFFVVLKSEAQRGSTMGWFRTLEAAKAALGERPGSIWKNGRDESTGGEKVFEQR